MDDKRAGRKQDGRLYPGDMAWRDRSWRTSFDQFRNLDISLYCFPQDCASPT